MKNKNKNKNKRLITLISLVLLLLIALSLFISMYKFNVRNPFKVGGGLVQIFATDKEYVEIQSSPKVIITQSNDWWETFENYISSQGYTYLEDERMGAIHVIEKDGIKEHVVLSVNGYYSKWVW